MDRPKSILRIEFCTGTTILETLTEMKEIAKRFGVAFVYTKLNDVDVYVSQTASIKELFDLYQDAVNNKKPFICQ